MAYAKVLGATNRQDGYLEGNGYLVSWCVGHLVELAPPNVYDAKYVKWSIADLPILPQKWQYLVSASTKKQFGMYNSPNGYYFIITRICDNSRIGSFCAFPDETEQIIDIGYCIHQLYWRQGYATECLKMIIEWAQTQNFTTITAEVAKDNIASCKLLEKFNFKIKKESSYKKYHMNIEFKSYIFEYHITKPH